jgi:Asp-tRNA(Asn)/Glu-tRNA(Gln) amidotransferase A subunit family amidase
VPRNFFDGDYIPGGSSSGSAVAVAIGAVAFAFGTDTAASGRVPAGFNNLVGLKPTALPVTRAIIERGQNTAGSGIPRHCCRD